MKRIFISSVAMLCFLITSISVAFEPPISGNWIFVAGDE